MPSKLRFLFLLPLAALIACGSSAPAVGGIAPISGEYVFNVTQTAGGAATSFTGALYISGSSVTGTFTYTNANSACNAQSFPVIGSIDSAGDLMSLSSSAFTGSFSGNTVTISLKLPLVPYTSGSYNTTGTAQITAGSSGTNCALASSAFTAQYLPPYSGTWIGTLTSGSSSITATLMVSEPITTTSSGGQTVFNANAAGQFPATATLNFNGAACYFTATPSNQLTLNNIVSGQVSGYTLQLSQVSSGITVAVVSASETTSPITFNILITGGSLACPNGTYSGTMAPQ